MKPLGKENSLMLLKPSNSRLSFLVSRLMLEQKQNADNKENLAPRPPQPQQKMAQQRCQRPQLKRITVTSS